ncbi:Zn-dependent hydrolase, glyoxylase [SAR116 cluster alpha proteobacterium HIMB100]|nr:Zn-dependent hydrolase, glyoxylase [SAR116 cluster alpha proteobacterium HIMB100]
MTLSSSPEVKGFFDQDSGTISYVAHDRSSKEAAVIDSVLDFDYASGTIGYELADDIIGYVQAQNLNVSWHIETHVHADHLSAAPYLQDRLGGKIMISEQITAVQKIFGKVFNAGTEFERDGSQFDRLLEDGDSYALGQLTGYAIHTPGHTPACMAHVIGDAVFVGDTLFMPDGGTARADFPGGDARTLYQSIQKILALPEDTRLFVCHDYMPGGREVAWQSTVAEQKQKNIHIGGGISEDAFVEMRETRDASLSMPKLIMPSIQVNMRAGHLPPGEDNGEVYLKVPVSGLRG